MTAHLSAAIAVLTVILMMVCPPLMPFILGTATLAALYLFTYFFVRLWEEW